MRDLTKFEAAIEKTNSKIELIQAMRENAPHPDNCFTCKQRFRAQCPVFQATNADIDMYCAIDKETYKIVAIFCVTGCGTYAD